ncbi:DUF4926 domain-containing protein [Deltaproteobacteria bacterium Smac51]|nr:DUF4926 domain-containing protein [Deltaproteobacteria bacterium Smac51]
MKYKQFDVVVLTEDIEEYDLKEGTVGTIVDVYTKPEGYEIEFFDENGKEIMNIGILESQILPYKG